MIHFFSPTTRKILAIALLHSPAVWPQKHPVATQTPKAEKHSSLLSDSFDSATFCPANRNDMNEVHTVCVVVVLCAHSSHVQGGCGWFATFWRACWFGGVGGTLWFDENKAAGFKQQPLFWLPCVWASLFEGPLRMLFLNHWDKHKDEDYISWETCDGLRRNRKKFMCRHFWMKSLIIAFLWKRTLRRSKSKGQSLWPEWINPSIVLLDISSFVLILPYLTDCVEAWESS